MDDIKTNGYFWSDSEYRYIEEKATEHLAKVVYEDNDPVFSGLLNYKGEKLYKVKEKHKIGFF